MFPQPAILFLPKPSPLGVVSSDLLVSLPLVVGSSGQAELTTSFNNTGMSELMNEWINEWV